MDLYGRDLITTQEWEKSELEAALDLAGQMKRDRFSPEFTRRLEHKTFIMFFYNPSVRTRLSFEAAMTELGGHAQFLTPSAGRFKTSKQAGETIEDAATVMARYAAGIGIRILEDKVPYYGAGTEFLREYAHWADVPILNMADDRFHPFQGLADLMGWAEWLGGAWGVLTTGRWRAKSSCSPGPAGRWLAVGAASRRLCSSPAGLVCTSPWPVPMATTWIPRLLSGPNATARKTGLPSR